MLENIYVTKPATWLHAAKNGAVHAYRDRLREISAVRGGELQRRVWYTEPLPADGKPGGEENSPHLFNLAKYHYQGRMDLSVVDPALHTSLHVDDPNTQYYMCGPGSFMEDQRNTLIKLGVKPEHIHTESF